ncbi:hypothetical protein [Spirulina sp. 06S082]|uniref:hypothetical protein n=1 Tax=Spirulina sp. 06S082 TaxID=3110248 RepID=UPI002B1ECF96|nr:hypothetical protein [Spirulina sp. 06S082]MEA5472370.1 hypothetical protein [Spirulina sp. 06S082]
MSKSKFKFVARLITLVITVTIGVFVQLNFVASASQVQISPNSEGFPFVFVEIPNELTGDPYQPNSVKSPGNWYNVGEVELMDIQVEDPELDSAIEIARKDVNTAYDKVVALGQRACPPIGGSTSLPSSSGAIGTYNWCEAQNGFVAGNRNSWWGCVATPLNQEYIDKLRANCGTLTNFVDKKNMGYTLIRDQRYEASNGPGFTIEAGNSVQQTFSVTYGSQSITEQTVEESVGYTFGTEKTSSINGGLVFGGKGLTGNIGISKDTTTREEISNVLRTSTTNSQVTTETSSFSQTDTLFGCQVGARYVPWVVRDQLTLIRHFDNRPVSEVDVLGSNTTRRYFFYKNGQPPENPGC